MGGKNDDQMICEVTLGCIFLSFCQHIYYQTYQAQSWFCCMKQNKELVEKRKKVNENSCSKQIVQELAECI